MTAYIELGIMVALFALIGWAIYKGKDQNQGDKKRPD